MEILVFLLKSVAIIAAGMAIGWTAGSLKEKLN